MTGSALGLPSQPGSDVEHTNASAVVYPIPARFTPVTSTVLPRMTAAKALATSRASVFSLKSGCVVVAMVQSILRAREAFKLGVVSCLFVQCKIDAERLLST